MRQRLVLLVSAGAYRIPDWVHPAVFQIAAGTGEFVGVDKTIWILQVQPTIGTASRHNHDDVSGSGAKKLRKGRRVFRGGFLIKLSELRVARRILHSAPLREVLVTRDQITADLAKGDPAAVSEIQRLPYLTSNRLRSIDGLAQETCETLRTGTSGRALISRSFHSSDTLGQMPNADLQHDQF